MTVKSSSYGRSMSLSILSLIEFIFNYRLEFEQAASKQLLKVNFWRKTFREYLKETVSANAFALFRFPRIIFLRRKLTFKRAAQSKDVYVISRVYKVEGFLSLEFLLYSVWFKLSFHFVKCLKKDDTNNKNFNPF